MARLQSKSSGRRAKPERIHPREFRMAVDAALLEKGQKPRRWGSFKQPKKKSNGQAENVEPSRP